MGFASHLLVGSCHSGGFTAVGCASVETSKQVKGCNFGCFTQGSLFRRPLRLSSTLSEVLALFKWPSAREW